MCRAITNHNTKTKGHKTMSREEINESIGVNCKKAGASYFECTTTSEVASAAKVRINADIIVSGGRLFHHINTDEIRRGLEKAVCDATWFVPDPTPTPAPTNIGT